MHPTKTEGKNILKYKHVRRDGVVVGVEEAKGTETEPLSPRSRSRGNIIRIVRLIVKSGRSDGKSIHDYRKTVRYEFQGYLNMVFLLSLV